MFHLNLVLQHGQVKESRSDLEAEKTSRLSILIQPEAPSTASVEISNEQFSLICYSKLPQHQWGITEVIFRHPLQTELLQLLSSDLMERKCLAAESSDISNLKYRKKCLYPLLALQKIQSEGSYTTAKA